MNVREYFRIAGRIAMSEDHHRKYRRRYLMGAVAIRNDGVIVISKNTTSKTPNQKLHAESRVLKKAGKGAILFVVRICRANGIFKMAHPCKKCMAEIQNREVRRVYYTISNREYGSFIP
jgi:tRNA(Arg) A34 adenosine deaminase TadA